MSDSSDGAPPGPDVLVLRAVFVPEGEDPPAEFMSGFEQLHFPVTLDPATGELTGATPGTDFDGDVRAEWHPDEAEGDDGEVVGGGAASGNAPSGGNSRNASMPPSNAGPPRGSQGRSLYLAGAVGGTAQSRIFAQAASAATSDGSLARSGVASAGGAKANARNSAVASTTKPEPGADGGPANFKRFFDTLDQPAGDLAKELGVPKDYIPGHFAWESGYLNDHNFALKNPLGFTAAGGNNLSFASIADATAAYKARYGEQIKGATSAKDFVERLQGRSNGKPIPGWHKYNSRDPKYEANVLGLIRSVNRHEVEWRKQNEPAQ